MVVILQQRPARRLPEEGAEDAESFIPASNGDTSAAQVTDASAKKPKAKRNRKPKSAQNGEHAEGAQEARIDDEGHAEGGKPKGARAPRQKTALGEPSKVCCSGFAASSHRFDCLFCRPFSSLPTFLSRLTMPL